MRGAVGDGKGICVWRYVMFKSSVLRLMEGYVPVVEPHRIPQGSNWLNI